MKTNQGIGAFFSDLESRMNAIGETVTDIQDKVQGWDEGRDKALAADEFRGYADQVLASLSHHADQQVQCQQQLRSELDSQSIQLNGQEKTLRRLDEQAGRLDDTMDLTRADIGYLKEEGSRHTVRFVGLEGTSVGIRKDLETLAVTVQEIEQDLREGSISSLEANLQQVSQGLEQVKGWWQNANVPSRFSSLQKLVQGLDGQIQTLADHVRSNKSTLDAAAKHRVAVSSGIQELGKRLDQVESREVIDPSEIPSIRARQDGLVQRIDQVDETVARVETKFDEANQSLMDVVAHQGGDIQELRSDLGDRWNSCSGEETAFSRIEGLRQDQSGFLTRIDLLEQDVPMIRGDMGAFRSELDACKNQLLELQADRYRVSQKEQEATPDKEKFVEIRDGSGGMHRVSTAGLACVSYNPKHKVKRQVPKGGKKIIWSSILTAILGLGGHMLQFEAPLVVSACIMIFAFLLGTTRGPIKPQKTKEVIGYDVDLDYADGGSLSFSLNPATADWLKKQLA